MSTQQGTNATYTLRRLRRDAPPTIGIHPLQQNLDFSRGFARTVAPPTIRNHPLQLTTAFAVIPRPFAPFPRWRGVVGL